MERYALAGRCADTIASGRANGEGRALRLTHEKRKSLIREMPLHVYEEIIARVRTAGIIRLVGAGFPTNIKLMPKTPDLAE